MTRVRVAGGVLALTVAASLSAQAPDRTRKDTTAVELAPIEVVGSILPTAGPTIGSGIPARVATVTGEEIDAWEPRLLTDALAGQAGISLYDDLGTPWKLNLSTRGWNVGPVVGLPPGVSVFLDGVRQNEPDAAEVNFDLLPMEHIERIELLSGSGSLLGSNSLGGAINLITRRGRGPFSGSLEASAGSFGNYSGEGSVAGSTAHGLSYYAAGGYEEEGGWRQATRATNYNGFTNLGKSGLGRGISLQTFAAHSRAETAGSLPESLFDRDPSRNFTVGDFEDLDLLQIAADGYLTFGTSRLKLNLYHRRSNAERFNVNQAPDDNVRSLTNNRTVGGTADWRWSTATGQGVFSLRVGLDGAVNRVHVRLFEEDPVSGDDSLTTDAKSPSGDVAVYTLLDYRTGRVTFSGGARYDYIRIPFRNLLDPTADTVSNFQRLSPRAGVSVEVGSGGSVYASVGRSFRAPAVLELACADSLAACPLPFALGDDPPLKPVVASTYEVGGKWIVGSAIMSASLYRTDVQDDIGFIQSANAVFQGYFSNIGDTRRDGIEVGLQVFPSPSLSLYANYAYTRATYRSNANIFSIRSDIQFSISPLAGDNAITVGSHLPLVPAHQLKGGALIKVNRFLGLGMDARYIGKQWLRGDEANQTSQLEGYFTTSVRAGVSVGPWEVNAVVTNLFDTHRANFGTFNENRQTGELERFLTPVNARALKVVLSRRVGAGGAAD
ncbi:MAG TPA: TonB-dependent receptor [Gemmatimonadales bacterium]|jgi:outer membrane receptor protein involved in Fe transport